MTNLKQWIFIRPTSTVIVCLNKRNKCVVSMFLILQSWIWQIILLLHRIFIFPVFYLTSEEEFSLIMKLFFLLTISSATTNSSKNKKVANIYWVLSINNEIKCERNSRWNKKIVKIYLFF